MDDVDVVLARIGEDPAFRDAMRTDPRSALAPWSLSTDDLTRIQADLARRDPADPLDPLPTVRALLGEEPGDPAAADETGAH